MRNIILAVPSDSKVLKVKAMYSNSVVTYYICIGILVSYILFRYITHRKDTQNRRLSQGEYVVYYNSIKSWSKCILYLILTALISFELIECLGTGVPFQNGRRLR